MNSKRNKFGKKIAKKIFGRSFLITLFLLLQFILLGVCFFLLTAYLNYIFVINLILSFLLAVYIVNRQESPEFKIAWLTFMCLLPIFGILYYLYFEINPKWRTNAVKVQKLIKDTSYLLEVSEETQKGAGHDIPGRMGLLHFLQKKGSYPVYDDTDAEYYNSGEKGFEAMKTALKNAKTYIFMEYFIVLPGTLLDDLIEILKERAAAGVEIRIMYDGFCHTKTLPYLFPETLRELGIHVNVFEPLSPFLSTDQNNRDHRKITVIDGEVAFTGGFNLSDEYANYTHPLGHWKDVVVKIKGDAVKTFVVLFLQNWHLKGDKREDIWENYIADGANKPKEHQNTGKKGYVVPYADSPNIHNEIGETVYLDILNQAQKYVWIMSPYLVLGSVILKAVAYAAQRGIDVKIMIPHIPDKKIPFMVAKSFYPELIRAGVKIYEYTPGFVHAKIFVSDDAIATVGSYNMDSRSFYLNYEVGLLLADCPAVKVISDDYENTRQLCQEINIQDYMSLPFTSRIIGKILRLFGPLL
ncbi:MAG: cardiolipin synthase [Eubacteriales bacterium]